MNIAILSTVVLDRLGEWGSGLLVKSTLLLGGALVVHALLRRRHSLGCSALWNGCVVALLILALVELRGPTIDVPMPWLAGGDARPASTQQLPSEHAAPSSADSSSDRPVLADRPNVAPAAPLNPPAETLAAAEPTTDAKPGHPDPTTAERPNLYADVPTFDWRGLLLVLYAAGVLVLAMRLMLNLRAVRRLRVCVTRVDDESWNHRREYWSSQLGVRGPVELLASDAVTVPVVIGWLRPAIMVPRDHVTALSGRKRDAVLLHEMAHVRRGDYAWQVLFLLVQAIYWPQPLVWLAGKCLGRLRERACDDVCIHALGGGEYRATLLDLAAALVRPHRLSLGLAAVRSSKIARRLAAIDTSSGSPRCQAPRATRWSLAAVFIGIAILVGAVQFGASAAGQPAASRGLPAPEEEAVKSAPSDKDLAEKKARLTGTVVDSEGKPVARIPVTVYQFDEPRVADKLTTNERGEFSVPREWTNWKLGRKLLVKHGDSIGFFDIGNCFRTAQGRGRTEQSVEQVDSFKIHLHKPTRKIAGILVDEQQQPIAGATITVESLSGDGEQSCQSFYYHGATAESPLGDTRSNERGAFTIAVPPLHYCGLKITHPRFASRSVYPQKPKGDDLGTVALARGGSVAGRVIDAETNKPIAGAWIGAQALDPAPNTGSFGHARSDEDGRYEISGLYPGPHNILFMPRDKESIKTAVAHESIDLRAGATATADFQVITGQRVAGRVVDITTGRPLVEWPVGYYGTARPQSGAACLMVDTDGEGRFEFFVPPGETYVYIAKGTVSHPQNNRRFLVESDSDVQPIVLKGAEEKVDNKFVTGGYATYAEADNTKTPPGNDYVLRVRVRTADGRPMASAIYELRKKGADYATRSGEVHGNEFRVEGGSAFGKPEKGLEEYFARNVGATYVLSLEPRGYARPQPIEFLAGKDIPPLTIDLKKPEFVPIRGRVVDAEGRPIENADVSVELTIFGDQTQKPWGAQYLTDANGRFQTKHTYVGNRVAVHITKDGWSGVIAEPRVIADAKPIDLGELRMTEPNGVIEGRVVDINDEGLPGILVTALPYKLQTRTDAKGRFRFTNLPLGEASVNILDGDYQSYPRKVAVGTKDMLFKLFPKSPEERPDLPMIRGKFRTADGKPVTATSYYWWFDIAGEPELWMSATREGDSFEFSNVWPHPLAKGKPQRLVIDVAGYKRPEPIEVATNKNLDLTIVLERAEIVPLGGRVTDEAGQPVAGATVWTTLKIRDTLYSDASGSKAMTDEQGRFSLAHIKDGDEFRLHIGKPGFAGVVENASARAGQPLVFSGLRLRPARARLTGVVLNREKKPVAGARVYTNYLGKVFETTTDSAGKFALAGLPDGNVMLSVEAETFRTNQPADSNSKGVTIVERSQY
jgi:beta-lactamase regulating signal transducer with metallopeptidase domain/protocatechuate 3,4-dioxygenase beta subunit